MTSTEAPLPADPVAYRRKGLSAWFWLVVLFGIVCIALGVVMATFAPSWLRGSAAKDASAPVLPWLGSTAEPVATPVPTALTSDAAAPTQGGDVSSLSARVEQLEANQARTLQAASAALVSASLIQAAQTSRPFATELAAVQAYLPPSADLAQLQRLAQNGAPTRTTLASEFPDAASRAITASRAPDDKASLFERARHAVSAIITIRRVDYVEGSGPHAVLARAEAKVNEGDVEGALIELEALPPSARDSVAGWRARAERRAEIDRRLAAVRESALRVLRETAGAAG